MASTRRLIYVSRAIIAPLQLEAILADIKIASVERNSALNVTGALLHTGLHFVQILEGDPEPISQLMRSISADPRHQQVDIVADYMIEKRWFESWMSVSISPALYTQRLVVEAMQLAKRGLGDKMLVRLLHEYAQAEFRPAMAARRRAGS